MALSGQLGGGAVAGEAGLTAGADEHLVNLLTQFLLD